MKQLLSQPLCLPGPMAPPSPPPPSTEALKCAPRDGLREPPHEVVRWPSQGLCAKHPPCQVAWPSTAPAECSGAVWMHQDVCNSASHSL
jgi:hypothetical protein